MRTFYHVFLGPMVLLTALSSSSLTALAAGDDATQHPVSPSVLASTVAEHVTQQDADRAAIRATLNRPEVKNIAARVGIDLTRAAATISTLDGASLDQAAATARSVNDAIETHSAQDKDALSGGSSTIIISSETLIVILLLVLLIVLVR